MSTKMPGRMTGLEVRQVRMALGLSTRGLAALLCMPESGDRTVRRWESGKQPDIPGPVQALLTVLEQSKQARDILGVAELARRYQPGVPGPRPAEEPTRRRAG